MFSSVIFWIYDHEAILCREVVNVNPYTIKKGSTKRSSMWEKIADTLNNCAVPKFRVDKRSVRDHVGNLIYKHKKKLQAEEKATGITPDCTHLFNQQRKIPLFHLENRLYIRLRLYSRGKTFHTPSEEKEHYSAYLLRKAEQTLLRLWSLLSDTNRGFLELS